MYHVLYSAPREKYLFTGNSSMFLICIDVQKQGRCVSSLQTFSTWKYFLNLSHALKKNYLIFHLKKLFMKLYKACKVISFQSGCILRYLTYLLYKNNIKQFHATENFKYTIRYTICTVYTLHSALLLFCYEIYRSNLILHVKLVLSILMQ